MKRYTRILAVALILAPSISFAGGGGGSPAPGSCSGECNKIVNICQGEIQNCVVGDVNVRSAKVMGAAGDKLAFDTSKVKITNYGRLTKTKDIKINLSLGQQIVQFTPTAGSQKERQMKFLLYPFDINNMPKGLSNPNIYKEAEEGKKLFPWAKSMLKTYRQMSKEEQWTEVIATFLDANVNKIGELRVEIHPDARATIHLPPAPDAQGNRVEQKPLIGDLAQQFD